MRATQRPAGTIQSAVLALRTVSAPERGADCSETVLSEQCLLQSGDYAIRATLQSVPNTATQPRDAALTHAHLY